MEKLLREVNNWLKQYGYPAADCQIGQSVFLNYDRLNNGYWMTIEKSGELYDGGFVERKESV